MVEKKRFTIPRDWEYRGEGNCHVVLGLPKMKKVLRIRKRDKPRNLLQWLFYFIEDYISWWYDFYAKEESRDLNFHSKIMRPLFGFKYVSAAKQVNLYKKQVKKIELQLAKVRPDFRKHKILQYRRATLFHDFTTLDTECLAFQLAEDTFSIEIKPKKGWIPFSERHFPECIYCMNQYIKLEMKKISTPSNYCPKKFFSGDEDEIKNSILSLIKNPQNNFRIFKNGTMIFSEDTKEDEIENILKEFYQNELEITEKLLNDFSFLLYKCLTMNFLSQEHCQAKLFCEWDKIIQGDSLPKGCILEKILSIQMLDAEGTKYYNKLMIKNISDWGYVNKLLNSIDTKMCVKCALLTLANSEHLKRKELLFAPYLVAAVVNDCSLMITLKKIEDYELEGIEMKNVVRSKLGSFLVKVGVFDLYPKPMSTIQKHEVRNKKLLEMYNTLKSKQ